MNERLFRTDSLESGPRRAAVEKIDRDIDVAEFAINMHLDTGSPSLAYDQLQTLKVLRAERQRLLTVSVLDIPEEVPVADPRA